MKTLLILLLFIIVVNITHAQSFYKILEVAYLPIGKQPKDRDYKPSSGYILIDNWNIRQYTYNLIPLINIECPAIISTTMDSTTSFGSCKINGMRINYIFKKGISENEDMLNINYVDKKMMIIFILQELKL